MKTHLKRLAIAICLFGAVFQLHPQGYIVPNGVTYIGLGGLGGYETHVIQNPTNGDYTGFLLRPQTQSSFSFSPFADEGVRVFLVSSNQPLSLQPILDNSYSELMFPNSYTFDLGSSFYLGFYTGYAPVNGVYSNPLFGWAQFVNNQGVIQMLGSALEHGGSGIYVGTQNIIPIPEPTALGLFAIGGLFLALHRRRRK